MTAITEVHKGRQALIAGKAQAALAHFQRATELDPDFLYFSTLPQSAVTYSGRALYQLGRFSEARQAFEQATLRFVDDAMARLYLGITLVRQDHREQWSSGDYGRTKSHLPMAGLYRSQFAPGNLLG